jgi:3-hydroxyisobutyrate dehydrogenase-like beta-hydroxyacid dehydrogenase
MVCDASRDKIPRAVLPRTFDYGVATGFIVKDVRLCLDQIRSLELSRKIAQAVGRVWESVLRETGPDSDVTSVLKPMAVGETGVS